jgi:hypothetical protein
MKKTAFRFPLASPSSLFSMRRRFKQTTQEVGLLQRGLPPTEWVLARALCRFRRFELQAVPKAQQAQALDLDISHWSPHRRTGRAIILKEGVAHVWIWDAEVVEAAQRAHNIDPRHARVIPETILRPAFDEGGRLLQSLQGYEGQIWRGGQLLHSAWWPGLPDADAWRNFQRDASLPPAAQQAQTPQPQVLAWLPQPWAKPARAMAPAGLPGFQGLIIGAGIFILLAASFWYGAQNYQLTQARAALEQEQQAAQAAAEQVLTMRGEALERMAKVEAFRSLDPYPDSLTLMARIAELIPAGIATLRDWEYENGRLKFVLSLKSPMLSSQFVKTLQGVSAFDQVQAQSSTAPDLLPISLILVPHVRLELATKADNPAQPETPGAPATAKASNARP